MWHPLLNELAFIRLLQRILFWRCDSFIKSKINKKNEFDVIIISLKLVWRFLNRQKVTFQASSITEALHLYDQLIPLTPVMLALSAASPIFRGILSDVDTRWAVIGNSVDCRTKQEKGILTFENDI